MVTRQNLLMPRNVEIKAKISDYEHFMENVRKLCPNVKPEVIIQNDVFFKSEKGRMKLRKFAPESNKRSELIWYDRPDKSGPKLSDFIKVEVEDGAGLEALLRITNGEVNKVNKTRLLYMYGQTRVHVDKVEGLGSFMELEVCLRDDQSTDDGVIIAKDIMSQLEIPEGNLIEGAYADILSSNA